MNDPSAPLKRPLIVGIGGTMRAGSSCERLIAAVLAAVAELGADTRLFDGAALAALPHYAPDHPGRTPGQLALVDAVRQADGVVIGSPSYHGGVSGLVKNAIDLLDDLRLDARTYLDGRAVGLVVVAAGWQAGGVTLTGLRSTMHALRGWPTPLGISVNSMAQKPFDADGRLVDADILMQVKAQAVQVMRFARPVA